MSARIRFAAIGLISAVGLFTVVAHAAMRKGSGDANITIKASLFPAGSFEGGCSDKSCSGLEVSERGDKVVIAIPFSKLQVGTGMVFGGRTEHMQKVFGKSSKVTLAVDKGAIKLPEEGKSTSGSATGKLSLKDGGQSVSKKFSFKVTRKGKGYQVSSGSFDIDLEQDFKINVKDKLSKMGVHVKPKIEVRDVKFTVVDG